MLLTRAEASKELFRRGYRPGYYPGVWLTPQDKLPIVDNKLKAAEKKWREANPERYRELMRVAGKKWRIKNSAKLKEKSLRDDSDLRKKKSLW